MKVVEDGLRTQRTSGSKYAELFTAILDDKTMWASAMEYQRDAASVTWTKTPQNKQYRLRTRAQESEGEPGFIYWLEPR